MPWVHCNELWKSFHPGILGSSDSWSGGTWEGSSPYSDGSPTAEWRHWGESAWKICKLLLKREFTLTCVLCTVKYAFTCVILNSSIQSLGSIFHILLLFTMVSNIMVFCFVFRKAQHVLIQNSIGRLLRLPNILIYNNNFHLFIPLKVYFQRNNIAFL